MRSSATSEVSLQAGRARWVAASLLGVLASLGAPSVARADLESYVKAADSSFSWKIAEELDLSEFGKGVIVRLTSQTWRGIPWEHWLSLIRPAKVTHPDHVLLVIAGGSKRSEPPRRLSAEALIFARIARATESVVAVLGQVPNQPLFGELKEDALISYTFQKFLETKDETWPCLLPMTKSAVKAMDAIQAVAKEKFSQEAKSFVVTGSSKRGWTTWLTGAVDARVVAIAPMVIDTLNFPKQMPLQRLSFGGYSEQIRDYSEKGLTDLLGTPEGETLTQLVDPYNFRKKLTMPKLIVLGTNDPYWPVDAVKMYFGDLEGEKSIHYVPNAGHGLGPGAAEVLQAFYQSVVAGQRRPRFEWKYQHTPQECVLTIKTQDAPQKAELWSSSAPTRDFRKATWTGAPIAAAADGSFVGKLAVPEKGFAALFGRLTYQSGLGEAYALCTSVEVLGDKR